jgi:hypothetical protein
MYICMYTCMYVCMYAYIMSDLNVQYRSDGRLNEAEYFKKLFILLGRHIYICIRMYNVCMYMHKQEIWMRQCVYVHFYAYSCVYIYLYIGNLDATIYSIWDLMKEMCIYTHQ